MLQLDEFAFSNNIYISISYFLHVRVAWYMLATEKSSKVQWWIRHFSKSLKQNEDVFLRNNYRKILVWERLKEILQLSIFRLDKMIIIISLGFQICLPNFVERCNVYRSLSNLHKWIRKRHEWAITLVTSMRCNTYYLPGHYITTCHFFPQF